MIEYTVLDYEGEPVTIENGEILEASPPRATNERGCEIRYQVWNPDECDWEDEEPEDSESLWELESRCYYCDRL